MTKSSSAANKARVELTRKSPSDPKPSAADFCSTGVTLPNLASHGRTHGGLRKGHIYRYIGKSSSGKTFLCCNTLAEASINPEFKNYELIYDDVERGALMDMRRFFGSQLAERISPPARDKKTKDPIYSRTISDFIRLLTAKLKEGKPVVWVEDSLDSLSPDNDPTKMSDGRAKQFSSELRKLVDPISATKSILILVSQSKIDMRSMFGGEITTGGRSPEYYSTVDFWLTKGKAIKKAYKGKNQAKAKNYVVGHYIICRVRKNRISGKDRTVQFPFYPDYGIDDLGGCVDFLINSGHWGKDEDKKIIAEEFNLKGSRLALIQAIEKNDLRRELQVLTGKIWNEIEDALTIKRLPRYT